VLTHGHDDHCGFAELLRDEHGVPVSIHELDARSGVERPGTRAPAWASGGSSPWRGTRCGSCVAAQCAPAR
jgi:glyoxylase-like metal-dependent hydrolase (beta-lactamase superfamily II)